MSSFWIAYPFVSSLTSCQSSELMFVITVDVTPGRATLTVVVPQLVSKLLTKESCPRCNSLANKLRDERSTPSSYTDRSCISVHTRIKKEEAVTLAGSKFWVPNGLISWAAIKVVFKTLPLLRTAAISSSMASRSAKQMLKTQTIHGNFTPWPHKIKILLDWD